MLACSSPAAETDVERQRAGHFERAVALDGEAVDVLAGEDGVGCADTGVLHGDRAVVDHLQVLERLVLGRADNALQGEAGHLGAGERVRDVVRADRERDRTVVGENVVGSGEAHAIVERLCPTVVLDEPVVVDRIGIVDLHGDAGIVGCVRLHGGARFDVDGETVDALVGDEAIRCGAGAGHDSARYVRRAVRVGGRRPHAESHEGKYQGDIGAGLLAG